LAFQDLIRGGSNARYVPTRHLVYYRAGTVMAVPFDLARLGVTGSPAPVVEGTRAVVDTVRGRVAGFCRRNDFEYARHD
jgi:hypothetical protein